MFARSAPEFHTMMTEFPGQERPAKMTVVQAFLEGGHGDKFANIGTIATFAGSALVGAVEMVGTATNSLPNVSGLALGPLIVVSGFTGWRVWVGYKSDADKLAKANERDRAEHEHEQKMAVEKNRHEEEMARQAIQDKAATATLINAIVSAKVNGIEIDAETGLPIDPNSVIVTPPDAR